MKIDKDDPQFQEYAQQIGEMIKLARQWVIEHPKANPKIQWNYPKDAMVIGEMSVALEQGVVTANDEGRELLKSMGAFNGETRQPSVSMLRFALELFDHKTPESVRMPGQVCPSCNNEIEGVKSTTGKRHEPSPGDFSICAVCGELARFDENRKLRVPTEQDMTEAKAVPEMWDVMLEAQQKMRDAITKAHNRIAPK